MEGIPSQVIWRAEAPPAEPTLGVDPTLYAVGIPARDEAALIGRCLEALATQTDAPPFQVALVLNNCRDDTAGVIRGLATSVPFPLHVFEVELAPALADAAWARRLAMNAASTLTNAEGVVLTTDADSRVDANWVAAMADSIGAGADLVCGFVAPDFGDAPQLSYETLRRGALEFEYSQLSAQLCSL